MGTVKKLYQDQLVGGSGSAGQEVYPVTSTLGVYDTDNNQLQGVLDKVTTNLGLFTCGTAAATAAKTVSASKFVLMEGGSVKIKFTYANSADSPTLAIGSTAAKPIMFNGSAASASNSWGAGEIVEFFYDGTNWVGSSTSVSVSQNTSTGHTDITIGSTTTPVASVEEVSQLGQDLMIKSATGVKDGTTWYFNDLRIESGVTYYVKLVSGEGDGRRLGVSNQTSSNKLRIGEWVEIVINATGTPFIYVGSSTITNPPVLEIVGMMNKEFLPYLSKVDRLNISKYTGVQASSSWDFVGLFFNVNKSYFVKLVSGDGNGRPIAIGSGATTAKLATGKWVKFVAPATGTPAIYVGGQFGTAPIIEVATAENLLVENSVIPLEEKVSELGNNVLGFEINEYTGTHESGSAWMFNDLTLTANTDYFVKLVSGEGDGRKLGVGSSATTQTLKLGRWVKVTAPVSGTAFIYISGGQFINPPVLQIANASNLLIEDSIIPLEEKTNVIVNVINVSRDGTSKTGRYIHFSGLTAIADALNSITDASEYNRYIVHIEGEFHFTDPLTLTMTDGAADPEYSALVMKPYVDIEGDGANRSVIFVDFPANATFHPGKTFSDYQPVYFNGIGGSIRNMKIAGKNCRYSLHIDTIGAGVATAAGAKIEIENCVFVSYGAADYGGEMNCIGTGIFDGQRWNFKDCEIIHYVEGGRAFAIHPNLNYFKVPPVVNFENCTFKGNIDIHNYQTSNNTFVNFDGCTFTKGTIPVVRYPYYNNLVFGNLGDYTTMLVNGNKMIALFDTLNLNQNDGKGCVLRVVSGSTGVTSVVRFNTSSSAFNVIVGDSSKTGQLKTNYYWDTQYGYVFRDGGVGLPGQAFGTIDVDEHSAGGHTLGNLLGDCSTSNKQLGIVIDGNEFTITFNEDYTNATNAYVLGVINAVLGTSGIASVFCPADLYYPTINGLCEVKSVDDGAILKGMGVVFVEDGMRRAKNSDGYIDGVCLDDTSNGQTGRVITCGFIFSARTWKRFSTYDRNSQQIAEYINEGKTLGINPNMDGEFFVGATPAFLRCKKQNVLEFI